MTPTYLSIDTDFWNGLPPSRLRRDCERIVSALRARRVPVVAVMNHQQMLPYVSDAPARRLLHIDQHSDLCDSEVAELNCGSWVSFVSWRREGEYIWLRRHHVLDGECNGSRPIFAPTTKAWRGKSDWGRVKAKRVKSLPPLREILQSVVAAGLCMSPGYIDRDEYEGVFRSLVQQFNLPYKRGVRNEADRRVARRPS